MWEYTHYDELMHYGVKGMRWGVRRQRTNSARQLYRKRKSDAFDEYERTIAKIEKPYKRLQNLSKADIAREEAAEKKYRDSVTKAKSDYKAAKKLEKAQKIKTKEELKASIERGKKVCQRIAKNNPFDPEKHKTIYDALNKKDAADYRAYQKDFGKKEVAVILTALTGVTVATLLTPNKG